MINFSTIRLDNGLTLIHHHNAATRMVALNLLYRVGSRDEQPEHTGLAHLMEHLMFTGSSHAPSFDTPLQAAGGMSNAWTSVDVTNYYEILPAQNIETALWLERDRLLYLNIDARSIELQKSVVIEEFKQRYLNQPYGDLHHRLTAAAYHVHPYRWPTIGLNVDDIASVPADVVLDFYHRHYCVNNLIMCISGNIERDRAVDLARKWFGDIAPVDMPPRNYPEEPEQTSPREVYCESDTVPADYMVRAYHMCDRLSADFAPSDLLSDVLANGPSSRFKRGRLWKSGMFSDLDASVLGVIDPGLFFVRARLADGVDFGTACQAIDEELEQLLANGVTDYEVRKYANKFVTTQLIDNVGYDTKAARLCSFENLTSADEINREPERYLEVTSGDIDRVARQILRQSNCTTVYYKKKS